MALLALPVGAVAQSESEEKRQVSEKVQEGLTKLGPLQQAQNYDGMLAVVNELLKVAKPGSYEEHLVNDIRGKILLQKNQFADAIGPLERALELSDQHGFYEPRAANEMVYVLAQLYAQESAAKNKTPQQQSAALEKATEYARRSVGAAGRKPSPEAIQLLANILLNRVQLAGENPDPALLKEAESVIYEGLYSAIQPRDQFYLFLLFILQQRQDHAKAADVLEMLVKQNPKNATYWTQLAATYLAMAGDERYKRDSFENLVRSIHAIERAQANGVMTGPKDNLNLVGIYQQAGQFERAAELLEAGLKAGTIEGAQQNWESLASSYQQINKPLKAIEILREAGKTFPESGRLDFQAALLYYSMEKTEDAYRLAKIAIDKGGLDKPHTAWAYLAYWAYELGKFEEALEAADKALEYPESKNDNSLKNLREAIKDTIEARNAQEEIMKKSQKL